MIVTKKRELRAALRAMHQGREERDRQSRLICRHILESDAYRRAKVIGAYMALPREADITAAIQDALRQGKQVALPRCGRAPHMTLRSVSSLDELVPGAYGIPEPAEDAAIIPPEQLDLLLVPLEGIDEAGYRLGKGGGYYDCLLAQSPVTTIGCALSWQQVRALPRQAWDQPLAACADQHGVRYFQQGCVERNVNDEGQEEAED